MFNDSNLSVREFRREGLLSDGDTDLENSGWYRVIYDAISEDPTKFAISGATCYAMSNIKDDVKRTLDCTLKAGEQICKDTGSPDVCNAVKVGRAIVDALPDGNTDTNTNTGVTAPDTLTTQLDVIVKSFGKLDCASMSENDRIKITNELNRLEPQFVEKGRKAEFDKILERMTCDVVKEFKCNNTDDSIKVFVPNPICKPCFKKAWLKPVAVGGATGVGVGFAFNKIAKGPVTYSIIAGLVAGGGVTYYLHNKVMKDYEAQIQEVS